MFGARLTLERTATHQSDQMLLLSLRECKICLTCAGDIHRFRLFRAFVPGDDVVLAIRNVVDFVVPAGVSLGEVGRGADDDVARHFRVNVAQQRHNPGWSNLYGRFSPFGQVPRLW